MHLCSLVLACVCSVMPVGPFAREDPDVAGFNYAIGTQTFGPSYHFTGQDAILESSQAIAEMGSSIIKAAGAESREDLLALPFRTYFSWYETGEWQDGVSAQENQAIRDAAYAKTKSLLTRFNGTGRAFFLGHWEGDWLLMGGTTNPKEPTATAIQGMIDWLNARQRGIDEAKRDTPHKDVEVWQYTEVNRVRDAMVLGKQRIVNAVLPNANVDFVSYSSYDIMRLDQASIDSTLDYVAAKLAPKPGIAGKRVFIGEFGIPADESAFDGAKHEKANRDIMVKFLRWGCPYVLYWEMYNNEVRDGKQRGYWLIDDKRVKQPLWFTFQRFLAEAKAYVAETKARTGKVPSAEEYLAWSADWLARYPSVSIMPGPISGKPGRMAGFPERESAVYKANGAFMEIR